MFQNSDCVNNNFRSDCYICCYGDRFFSDAISIGRQRLDFLTVIVVKRRFWCFTEKNVKLMFKFSKLCKIQNSFHRHVDNKVCFQSINVYLFCENYNPCFSTRSKNIRDLHDWICTRTFYRIRHFWLRIIGSADGRPQKEFAIFAI